MAELDWDDVAALAPELATIDDDAQDLILDHVNADLDPDMFDGEDGPTTRIARIWLAAHLASWIGKGNKSGAITSQSALGLSQSFAQAANAGSLSLTVYGQLYLGLATTSFARLPVLI